jgi:hypothetical protein
MNKTAPPKPSPTPAGSEQRDGAAPPFDPDFPAAGPHAKPELTNPDATPGTGLLPDPNRPKDAPDSASS